MPYVHVRVAGELTLEQKKLISQQMTEVLSEVASKPPSVTYVVIEEIKRDNWAVGGKLLSQ